MTVCTGMQKFDESCESCQTVSDRMSPVRQIVSWCLTADKTESKFARSKAVSKKIGWQQNR
jgi:hypothetical protein